MSVLDRALFLGRILTIGLRRVAVGALNVESQCSWAAVSVFGPGTDHVISVVCCGKDACLGQYWLVRYSL